MKLGSYLTLSNAKIEMVRGNMRLAIPQNSGKIEEAQGTAFEPKVRRKKKNTSMLCIGRHFTVFFNHNMEIWELKL